tara:strand:+ start:827 stop:955 length:129 start_codon:yes stop_codon:yes gene_type:complete
MGRKNGKTKKKTMMRGGTATAMPKKRVMMRGGTKRKLTKKKK